MNQTREISASLRVAALNLDTEQFGGEIDKLIDKLLVIANELDTMSKTAQWGGEDMTMAPGVNDLGAMGGGLDAGGLGGGGETLPTAAPDAKETAVPSKFGLDQPMEQYFKVNVEFLYINAPGNLEAREKIAKLLESIPDIEGKYNVGEAQGMSVKKPS